jgi:excisionase family DNA binding protein
MDATAPTKLLTVNEVAATLGCGRTLVYELLGRRELNHIKIGRLTRIPPSEVESFVRRRMQPKPTGVNESPSRAPRLKVALYPTLPLDG